MPPRVDELRARIEGASPAVRAAFARELHKADALESLPEFATFHDPEYKVDRFHAALGDKLDALRRGDIRKLVVMAPPQHGKSRAASVEFVAQWLGENPDMPVISTSYAAGLAFALSREVQSIIESPAFRELYPGIKIDPRHSAVSDWGLQGKRGGLLAAGVGGPITGRGAGLGVIDDPFKNWRDAQSLKIREAVWDWYLTTFSTRLWENARELLIMTRWHPDDLVGRILNDPKRAGRWEVANFPALAEPENAALPGWRPDTLGRESGEPLAPSRYSAEYLRVKQEEQGSIKWGSLYQQRPTVVEGGVIKVGKFVMRDGVPDDLVRSVRFWDLASTPEGAGADPDYTAGALMGQTARGNWVILSMIHGRLSPNTTRERFKQTAATDGQSVPIVIEQEPGSSGAFAISDLVSMVPGWNARGERASGPQLSRVLPFAAQVEAGNIELVRGPWVPAFIEECRSYRGDGSTHDDQVVAAAGAFRFLHSPAVALSTPSDDAEPDPELEVTEWDS